jgi:hypothetical protein
VYARDEDRTGHVASELLGAKSRGVRLSDAGGTWDLEFLCFTLVSLVEALKVRVLGGMH